MRFSPTLRKYHNLLWSKPLPNGKLFQLDGSIRGRYLCHQSELGAWVLASDSVIPTFTRWLRLKPITTQFPEEENEAFRTIGYTIGGMMVWPGVPINGQRTINVERGFNRRIADRMDLTLECIRRHYRGEDNPMSGTLAAYASYFALFENFRSFTDFFLLQDLVTADYEAVKFFMPFDDFKGPSTPTDVQTYLEYRRLSIEFVTSRNRRIDQWQSDELACSNPATI
jgi:hypothetical protein